MYETRVVGTYRHFQAKTSETDVTHFQCPLVTVAQPGFHFGGFRSLGAGPWVLRAPVSPEIQQNLITFSNVRGFKFSCFENGPSSHLQLQ